MTQGGRDHQSSYKRNVFENDIELESALRLGHSPKRVRNRNCED